MIRFHTLGPVTLIGPTGGDLRPLLSQPKRLALLSYLAMPSPGTVHRRDALLAMFWPELDQAHARAALRGTLFDLRSALGPDTLNRKRAEDVALEPAAFWCDAAALELALSQRSYRECLTLYRGDFMAGFHVSGCPEFERWLDATRARLRERAEEAGFALAGLELQGGRVEEAARAARWAAGLAPGDELAVQQLIAVLHQAGDRAGAVRAYEQFARGLAADFGVEPSPQTRALVTRTPEIPAGESTGPAGVPTGHDSGQLLPPSARRRWARTVRLALAVAAVVIGGWAVDAGPWAPEDTGGESSPSSAITLAVLPFSVHANSPQLAFLREGMVDLLAAKLNSAAGLRTVDPRAIISTPPRGGGGGLGVSDAGAVAREFGASYYVLGSVVSVGDSVQITASLYQAKRRPTAAATASVSGPLNELFGLVDRLTGDLVAGLGSPTQRLAATASLTTDSPAALRAYLNGERAFRQASLLPIQRFTEPIAAFRLAVKIDSTFALAYYRLAVAADLADSLGLVRWAVARARRYGSRLPEHYRSLADGLDAYINGDGRGAILAFQTAVAAHPDDAEAWLRLGFAQLNYGPLLGAGPGDLREPFTIAARLYGDQSAVPWLLLAYLAVQDGDFRSLDSLIRRAYPDGVPPSWHVLTAQGRGDTTAARTALRSLERAEPFQRIIASLLVTRYLSDADLGRHIAWQAVASARGSDWLPETLLWAAQVEWAAGRPEAATRVLDSLATLDPRQAAEFEALLSAWPVGPASRPRLEASRQTLVVVARFPALPHPRAPRLFPAAAHALRLYLLGLVSARLGDRREALAYGDSLAARTSSADLGSLTRDLALCLRAEVRAELDRAPAEALTLLGDARYQIPLDVLQAHRVLYQVFPRIRFLEGQWSLADGRRDEALRWYGSLGLVDQLLDLPVWAPAMLITARIHQEAGQLEQARVEYARAAALWQDAEPELRPLVAEARVHLARLSR